MADAPGEPISPSLNVVETRCCSVTPYHVSMLPCSKPKHTKLLSAHKEKTTEIFNINKIGVAKYHQLTPLGWVVATAISRIGNEGKLNKISSWAGYNPLLSTSQPVSQVGALPLLPEVAHNWSTLLTVMM